MISPPSSEVRVRFTLLEEYARALRIRAAYEDVYPRDVLTQALDLYLAAELDIVRAPRPSAEEGTAADGPM